ncbi:steroid 17-alpha-hydroxylase/17,20 lyase-like [Engraulis encrasicolus]|uniref:steroid 17-alpha-hydroxylase/17,20 lyase-like n=1 Tax=Engraulis encrasicolus TaxID=184585 RepID=UPI002FD0849F
MCVDTKHESLTPGDPRDLLDALLEGRGSDRDVGLSDDHVLTHVIGGHPVAKGTRVLVNMWAIHHDPQQWEQPDTFRPDRFLDDSGQRVVPPSFLPFGAGPRVCVGESLARMELFLFMSRLLQRCQLSAPRGASLPDLQGRYGVVLQPPKYTVTIKARN